VEHFLKVPSSEVRLLSVGTTTSLFSFPHVDGTKLGLKQWAGRLARVMIAAQQASVNDIVGHRLQDRYLRVDSVQAPELMPYLRLDVATEEARKAIRAMASTATQNVVNE
jgi:hypothetical protein